jgi:hypothetical protein
MKYNFKPVGQFKFFIIYFKYGLSDLLLRNGGKHNQQAKGSGRNEFIHKKKLG